MQRPEGRPVRSGGKLTGAITRLFLTAACLAALAVVAACGSSNDTNQKASTGAKSSAKLTPVRLQLDWIPKEEYAFLYGAKAQGIFAKHGIDLVLNPGKGSVLAMQVLNGGAADMAYVNVASFVQALSAGAQGKAVFGIIQQDPQEIVSFPDKGVKSIGDLAGKSLITSSTEGFALYYPYLLKQNGVNPSSVSVRRVDPAAKASTFASHRGDAVNLYQTQSIAPIEKQAGEQFVRLPSQQWHAGQLNVAENLVVMPDYLAQNAQTVKNMTAAMAEAWDWAQQHPEAAAKAIQPLLANAPLDQVLATVKTTLTLGHTAASQGKPTGWMAPEDWDQTVKNLTASGLVKKAQPATDYYTNEFVGG
jgi:NitT/TauT family transport system substrate-binding protein